VRGMSGVRMGMGCEGRRGVRNWGGGERWEYKELLRKNNTHEIEAQTQLGTCRLNERNIHTLLWSYGTIGNLILVCSDFNIVYSGTLWCMMVHDALCVDGV
jgi:hypothetical protein